tara:strand:- start:497 stop:1501 length:1005 start_codon:yes stop_codon:yes gene_type:complete
MRIGIFDIGTKAIRLLVGDKNLFLKEGFSFNHFANFGTRTYLGDHIGSDGALKVKGLEKTIIAIKNFKRQARKYNVKEFSAVGTAIFRNINNSNDILDIIKKSTGLDVNVLSKEDEAKFSLIAAINSTTTLRSEDTVVLIDQGGGSTEISFGTYHNEEKIEFNSLQSLDLGTVDLKNRLFSYDATVENVYNDLIDDSKRLIRKHKPYKIDKTTKAFGMGSGITNMLGKQSNKKQHAKILSPEKIDYIANKTIKQDSYLIWEKQPNNEFPNGEKRTIDSLKKLYNKNQDLVDRPLSILLGRIVYKEILDYYKIDHINVCAAGLRYGIFFQNIYNY